MTAMMLKQRSKPSTKKVVGTGDPMAKYSKMKKVGLPMDSIKNKMKMDGIDKIQIAKFAGEPVPKSAFLNGIDLSEYDLAKYDKMKVHSLSFSLSFCVCHVEGLTSLRVT